MNGRYWFVISVVLLLIGGSWATINLGDDIIPIVNDFFNIGSNEKRVNVVYAIDVDTNNIQTDLITDLSGDNLVLRGTGQDKDVNIQINDGGTNRDAIQAHGTTGAVSLPRQSKVMAYNDYSQVISSASFQRYAPNQIEYDTLGEMDLVTEQGRFTALHSGWYEVNSRVYWIDMPSTKIMYLRIYVNGATYKSNLGWQANNGQAISQALDSMVYLNAGDYIEIWVYHNSGVNDSIGAGPANSYVAITKVA